MGHTSHTGEKRNTYTILMGKPERKDRLVVFGVEEDKY
jgi:hypothetical protein